MYIGIIHVDIIAYTAWIMGSYLSHSANIVIHGQCSPADTLLITSVFDSTVKYAIWGRVGDRVSTEKDGVQERRRKNSGFVEIFIGCEHTYTPVLGVL
jgi:hypothetical protein